MPHLFCDLDAYIPGALGGLDEGDTVSLPWVRESVTAEQWSQGPLVGWYTSDLYCRGPREVRAVAGELLAVGDWGGVFAVRPREVFRDRPDEQRSYRDRDTLPRLA